MSKTVLVAASSASLLAACGGAVTPTADGTESDDAGMAQDAVPDAYWDGALPPNAVEGVIGGVTLTAASAVDTGGAYPWDSDLGVEGVALSSGTNLCNEGGPAFGESWLVIAVINLYPMDVPRTITFPTTMPVMNQAAAMFSADIYIGAAYFTHGTAMCQASPEDDATGGTLTIYEIGDATVAGAFDLEFPDGHASGTFNATNVSHS